MTMVMVDISFMKVQVVWSSSSAPQTQPCSDVLDMQLLLCGKNVSIVGMCALK